MEKTNASDKSKELNSVLSTHFQGKINLARIKFISHFIIALCKVQTITFEKKRWQIEMCFKAMKSSGFDIEKIHLQDIKRIEKLILLVMVAFVWCYKVGIYLHQLNPIKVKKHGRKAKSLFKYGLDYIASVFLNPVKQYNINITEFLSCT